MLSILMLAAITHALPQPDPYAPSPKDEAGRLAYRAEIGGDPEARAIETWLRRHPNAPAAQRAMLAHRLCLNLGVLVGGERRVAACRLSVELSGDAEDRSDLAIAEAFQNEPSVSATGSVTPPLARSKVGLSMIGVSANDTPSSWLVDSGAEISVVAESEAKKLNLRMVTGSAPIGTSTTIKVEGRFAMIDRLTIGTALIAHLPVLVLPDAMLRLPDGNVLPGILGLPALAAFHQVAWLDHGTRLALGKTGPKVNQTSSSVATRLYWDERGLGLALSTQKGVQGIFLDSGANASQLGVPALALLTPEQHASIFEEDGRVGGAGGTFVARRRKIPELDYMLAGTPLHAQKMDVSSGASDNGAIGNDVISQTAILALDFDVMTVEVKAAGQ
ncbi:retropepsin-like aspartic protease [Novosphingobium sp. AP12]|uniref:retropepsin-like aspartic protease n=1 Tax=Novosphingobium sp. AP12 TaxID=1144305 RepID=UPI000271FAC8|nr:retropepsin-like aspartic protease [Novosphingobium sp. AP12]EJL34178.1 Retroviral aspartyl protease [Novosphingobium sp. AP12]